MSNEPTSEVSDHRAHLASRLSYGYLTVAVVLVATYIVVLHEAPWLWIAYWAVGLALTALSPWRPAFGVAAYAFTFYGTPRYSDLFVTLAQSGLLHWQVALAATGTAIWLFRSGRTPRFGSPILLAAIALFVWGGIAAALASAGSVPSVAGVRHSSLFLVHALVLLIVASEAMQQRTAPLVWTVLLCAGLAVRITWQGLDGIFLEGDLGPTVLMVVPFIVLLARTEASPLLRVSMWSLAIAGVASAALTYNRATAVAFCAMALVFLWRYRRAVWVLLSGLSVLVVMSAWFATSPYAERFRNALAELGGTATGSVTERFQLWRVGFSIVSTHPFFGVGPGRYAGEVGDVTENLRGMAAHNTFVQIAAETGLPALVLFVALFALVMISAQKASRAEHRLSAESTGGAIQTSLVVYIVAGLFVSRHDMAMAYILAGWSAALATVGPRPNA